MAQTATPDLGEWPLKRLMTEVVGSGHRSADDMSSEQAREAMARILTGEPDATTLGAFLLANRWKRNTPTELAVFLDETVERSTQRAIPSVDPIDCGANYDGKGRTALLGVAAGIVSAAAGSPVVVHSGDRVPTQKQDAYKHVLDELGISTEVRPEESADMVDDLGFGFYYQPSFDPGIDALSERRDQMGVRTFINTVETLTNPAGASVHLGSFYHLPFAKRVIKTLRKSEHSPVDRVLMFQGLEGYDDVRPGETVVAEWGSRAGETEETIDDFEIHTEEYGMDFDAEALAVDEVAEDSAAITRAVLADERDDAFAEATILNAALRLYADEAVADIEAGMKVARDAITDGSAAALLADLKEY